MLFDIGGEFGFDGFVETNGAAGFEQGPDKRLMKLTNDNNIVPLFGAQSQEYPIALAA